VTDAVPAADPSETTETGQGLARPAFHAASSSVGSEPVESPLAGTERALNEVLPPSVGSGQGGGSGPSQHLNPGQFSEALSGGSGAAEAGAAESASGLAELAPLAAVAL
jgi:hypothetical protein